MIRIPCHTPAPERPDRKTTRKGAAMTDRRRFPLVVALLLLAAWVLPAQAWLRMPYADAEAVAHSETIVVGHLEKASLKYVPQLNTGAGGASWESRLIA